MPWPNSVEETRIWGRPSGVTSRWTSELRRRSPEPVKPGAVEEGGEAYAALDGAGFILFGEASEFLVISGFIRERA